MARCAVRAAQQRRNVLDCASPSACAARQSAASARLRLALCLRARIRIVLAKSARGLPQSKALRDFLPAAGIEAPNRYVPARQALSSHPLLITPGCFLGLSL